MFDLEWYHVHGVPQSIVFMDEDHVRLLETDCILPD